MTETIAYIHDALRELYPRSERNSFIRLIMERVCNLPPYKLLLGKDTQLSDTEKERIHEIVGRLRRQEPLQYILGTADFYGHLFNVNPSVLIPRPETEELADLIIREQQANRQIPLRILDIGTGSGCIAITLALHLKQAEVYAVDISEAALATATENADRLGANVHFIEADILSGQAVEKIRPDSRQNPPGQLEKPGQVSSEVWSGFSQSLVRFSEKSGQDFPETRSGFFDLIVSNPPYVMEKEKKEMDRNVLDYEPHRALFVPDDDPLLFYRAIARFGKQRLAPGGMLYLEINAQCGSETAAMLRAEGYLKVSLIQDLSNKDRIIKARR